MDMIRITSTQPEQTYGLGKSVAALSRRGDCITLGGELGVGKTLFAQGFIEALASGKVKVTSPTFALLQTYDCQTAEGAPVAVWHYDLYRIERESELAELGLEDALAGNHIVLIEWPERAASLMPSDRLEVHLKLTGEKERLISLHGSTTWRNRLSALRRI